MMSLINEKCVPAALPEVCLPRQDLMKRLKAAAEDRFVYIGAPAGSGKTVTALLWNMQEEAQGRKTLWITLDVYDNISSVFYKLFAAVLCSTQPNNKNMRTILEDPAFSSSPVEYTVRLIAEMKTNGTLYTLALDDLHLLNNQEILNSLPAVLKRLPQTYTVICLSRNDPPQPLRSMFMDEKRQRIDIRDICFSQKELKDYFQNLGRNITDKEAEVVFLATGGLAIGVNAIAKSDNIELGKTEYVFSNYVREYLWEKWDKKLRDFMLQTSIVDEITEKLAVTLTKRKDAGKVLQKLCEKNTFISHVGNGLYRYHHLFLSFLRDMTKASGMNTSALYKAAAKYYLDTKQYIIARHHAILSGNNQIIFKVIHQLNQYTNPTFDEYLEYHKIFRGDVFPKGICDRYPYLYTTIMEGALISSDCEAAESAWDKMRHYLPVIALRYPKILETVILQLCNDYRKSLAELIDDYSKLPPITRFSKKYQVSTFTIQLPFMHRGLRDWCELMDKKLLEKIERTLGVLLYDMLPVAKPCILSGFALEQNRIDEALALAMQSKDATASCNSPEAIFCVNNQFTAIFLAMGDEAKLKKSLEDAENYIVKSGSHFLDRNFLAWKTKIALFNADKKAAQDWLNNYFISDEDRVPLHKIFMYFTTARACIVLSNGSRAMGLLEKIIQFARDYRRPLDIAEALTLKACIEWASGRRIEAAATLKEALLILQEHRFIRIIADEGAAVVPILKRIGSREQRTDNRLGKDREQGTTPHSPSPAPSLDKEYITEVLLAAHETAKHYRGITANFNKSGKPVKLSKQQKKMLELLAKGYNNPEISKHTGLALPTVKGHLMLAYEKLEVHTAYDAILKAKSLGLLNY